MLTGTLDDFTLADVLRLVAGARRTGGLAVARDAGAGDLYFRDGAVSRGVGRYARRSEAASPDRAIEDLTFDLMRWGRGEFTWTPDATAPGGPEASVDVDRLLQDVSRRLDELAEIQTLVPSEDAVLTMAPQPPEGAVQINITPAEWRVLVLVDGHRKVAEIAATAGLDDLEAMRLLFGLATTGLVTAVVSSTVPVPPQRVSDMSDMSDTPREDMHMVPAAVSDLPEPPPAEAEPYPEPVAAEPDPEPVAAEAGPAPVDEPDPFLSELDAEPASPFDAVPAAPAGAHEAPAVDRSTAARELAGLFEDFEAPVGMQRMNIAASPPPPTVPRRVEDDDQVTRGLISRLIDGVKGL